MGNVCCCKRRTKRKIVLLLVGLDNAGKTVAAKGLAGEPTELVVPTVGFSIVNLSYLNYIVKVFDLGGGSNIRGIWHKYFVDAHGVIFVVDSSDIPRLDEARAVLQDLLSHNKISGKPVLLLANKQDNELSLDEVDIIDKLDLESIVNACECPTLVQSCSAVETTKIDPGIKKGYEWLLNYIARNYEELNQRVEEDVAQQRGIDDRVRQEKIEKIRARKLAEQRKEPNEDEIESYSNYERKMNGVENRSVVHVASRPSSVDLSSSSNDSFPPVYHVLEQVQPEVRPRSAVTFVRRQLQDLEATTNKKMSFVSRASNKTAPMFLYGVELPRSAGAVRKSYNKERRLLKSAGDAMGARVARVTDLPNVPVRGDGDDYHSEIYRLSKLRSEVGGGDRANGLPLVSKRVNGDISGISVVDVN